MTNGNFAVKESVLFNLTLFRKWFNDMLFDFSENTSKTHHIGHDEALTLLGHFRFEKSIT